MSEKIIERLEKLEALCVKYSDVITDDMQNLKREFALVQSGALKKKLEDNKGEHLLTIGIIGCVKAGKSSLLNSIFFEGQSVLPKAATPMTAALTVLKYGKTFSASVEFFTKEDIAVIKRGHENYKARWKEAFETEKKERLDRAKRRGETADLAEIEAKAKKTVDKDLNILPDYDMYSQYEGILKTGADFNSICSRGGEKLEAPDRESLMGRLGDYVGTGGKYMPFTKSVTLEMPMDSLRDVQIVDTPGINDPVRSREARTEEYLKECDAVLVISRAGHFIEAADMNLMDRISSKEGVQEIYLIASQIDNELYGSEVKEAAGNDLHRAVENQRTLLTNHAVGRLQDLASRHPETKGQFAQILQEGKERVIVCSSMCHAMSLRFFAKDSWDEEMRHVWGLLRENYGNFFDDGGMGKENLNVLANIQTVQEKLELTKSKKEELIRQKRAAYLSQQEGNIVQFHGALLKALETQRKRIEDGDIKKLEAEIQDMNKRYNQAGASIDGACEDCFEQFEKAAKQTAQQGVNSLIKNIGSEIFGLEYSETETYEVEKKGFWSSVARFFGVGGYEEKTRSHKVFRPGAAKSKLTALVNELRRKADAAFEESKTAWKKALPARVINEYQKAFSDDVSDDTDLLQSAIRNVLNGMNIPKFNLSAAQFCSSASGTLYDDEVDAFLESIGEYLENLKDDYYSEVQAVLDSIKKGANNNKMSSMLFESVKQDIEKLKDSIKNKAIILERLAKCSAELKEAV